MKKKIAITTTTFGEGHEDTLAALNLKYDVVRNNRGRKLDESELLALAADAVGIIAGTEKYTQKVLSSLPALKIISRCGTGTDNVDVKYAEEKGVRVLNTPDAPTLAVAELTIGLILDMLRKTTLMDRNIRENKWEKLMGNLLTGKKIGIIGFGRIGKKVSELLNSFSCEIKYFDPYVDKSKIGEKAACIEELLKWAEIITIHVSSNQNIIGEKELLLMPKGSWIINVSRGGTVDETALFNLLKSGHISGAALDVFEKEPYSGLLKGLDNVVLTPHIGSYAKESRIEMEKQSVENLIKGLEGKK